MSHLLSPQSLPQRELTNMGHRVLFISYNGMLDPLGQTQVIPYLRELSSRGVTITLLSFERPEIRTVKGHARREQLERELAASEIDWHWLQYHQRPSLPATFYDVMLGIRRASRLVRTKHIDLVHARSYVPAAIALRLKRRFGIKMIFDVRGLLADEYVDATHWRRNSLLYIITKASERRLFKGADAIVTLTQRIWPIISKWEGLHGRDILHEVVPCCADLDLFKFDAEARVRRRRELKLDGRFVIVYSGSIDGWYLTEEMADFFVALKTERPNAYLLWLTPARHQRIRSIMQQRQVSERDYGVVGALPSEVSSYLSASDAGLAFIKPCLSKLASSPTKYGEYLGCGLPLIINQGIGDSDALITEERVGVLVREFNQAEYLRASRAIERFTIDQPETRRLTRAIAENLFDVSRVGAATYLHLYETVLASQSGTSAAAR